MLTALKMTPCEERSSKKIEPLVAAKSVLEKKGKCNTILCLQGWPVRQQICLNFLICSHLRKNLCFNSSLTFWKASEAGPYPPLVLSFSFHFVLSTCPFLPLPATKKKIMPLPTQSDCSPSPSLSLSSQYFVIPSPFCPEGVTPSLPPSLSVSLSLSLSLCCPPPLSISVCFPSIYLSLSLPLSLFPSLLLYPFL